MKCATQCDRHRSIVVASVDSLPEQNHSAATFDFLKPKFSPQPMNNSMHRASIVRILEHGSTVVSSVISRMHRHSTDAVWHRVPLHRQSELSPHRRAANCRCAAKRAPDCSAESRLSGASCQLSARAAMRCARETWCCPFLKMLLVGRVNRCG